MCRNKRSKIEAVRCFGNDNLFTSSRASMEIFTVQNENNENKEEDIASMLINHKKNPVRLRITAIKRHTSNIELEEIPEEYE